MWPGRSQTSLRVCLSSKEYFTKSQLKAAPSLCYPKRNRQTHQASLQKPVVHTGSVPWGESWRSTWNSDPSFLLVRLLPSSHSPHSLYQRSKRKPHNHCQLQTFLALTSSTSPWARAQTSEIKMLVSCRKPQGKGTVQHVLIG